MKAVSVLLRQILCNVRPVSGEKQNCSGNLEEKKAKFDVFTSLRMSPEKSGLNFTHKVTQTVFVRVVTPCYSPSKAGEE